MKMLSSSLCHAGEREGKSSKAMKRFWPLVSGPKVSSNMTSHTNKFFPLEMNPGKR